MSVTLPLLANLPVTPFFSKEQIHRGNPRRMTYPAQSEMHSKGINWTFNIE